MCILVVGPRGVGKTTFCQSLCADAGFWFLNLDPARQTGAPLCTSALFGPGLVPQGFRFIGTLVPHRDPISSLAAIHWSRPEKLVIELPISSVNAVAVQFLRSALEISGASKIVSIGFESARELFQPLPSVEVELIAPSPDAIALPNAAESAWRKAHWKGSFEQATTREVGIQRVFGSRLGSGVRLQANELEDLRSLGLESAQYAEVVGSVLYIVIPGRAESDAVGDACHHFDCSDAHLVHPKTFEGLICGFENDNGAHAAIGRIVGFAGDSMTIEAAEIAFGSLWKLRMGRLRLDANHEEIGEIRAWQV